MRWQPLIFSCCRCRAYMLIILLWTIPVQWIPFWCPWAKLHQGFPSFYESCHSHLCQRVCCSQNFGKWYTPKTMIVIANSIEYSTFVYQMFLKISVSAHEIWNIPGQRLNINRYFVNSLLPFSIPRSVYYEQSWCKPFSQHLFLAIEIKSINPYHYVALLLIWLMCRLRRSLRRC